MQTVLWIKKIKNTFSKKYITGEGSEITLTNNETKDIIKVYRS